MSWATMTKEEQLGHLERLVELLGERRPAKPGWKAELSEVGTVLWVPEHTNARLFVYATPGWEQRLDSDLGLVPVDVGDDTGSVLEGEPAVRVRWTGELEPDLALYLEALDELFAWVAEQERAKVSTDWLSQAGQHGPRRPRFAAACPKGHREGLQLRFVADAPFTVLPNGDGLDPTLEKPSEVEVQEPGSEPGVDSGVWCPECDEWYGESECIHPTDDLGNPEIADLGEQGRPEEEEEEDEEEEEEEPERTCEGCGAKGEGEGWGKTGDECDLCPTCFAAFKAEPPKGGGS